MNDSKTNKKNYNRREWLKKTGLFSAGLLVSGTVLGETRKENPVILLVSGWQNVNIGDIAHTPGLLHVFEVFLPEARVILWKRTGGEEVKELLNRNFPKVRIIYGGVTPEKDANQEVMAAINEADIMVHGSGPLLVGADHLACWMKHTDKPFGVFGTTLQNPGEYHQSILKKASFIYTRETNSIQHLKKAGIEGPHISFAPDATFYMHINNPDKAESFLNQAGLEAKKFICVIPRLRYTPYHTIYPDNNDWTRDWINHVEKTNEQTRERDHAKLREAMIAWVRETGNKVLVCPEMTYQMDIMDELLIDPLPADVKPFVIERGYWLPDEAASVYAKAHTVLSFECHSPIIAAYNGTPFFYLRQPEDSIKGQMYYDLGFDNWIFEIEETEGRQITDTLRQIWKDYPGARAHLKDRMKNIGNIYSERVNMMKKLLSPL